MKPVTLYSGSAGLNTVLDPQRIDHGNRQDAPGVIELAQAVDVAIDEKGLIEVRPGSTIETAGDFHSIFCDGGDCFVVKEQATDAAIMKRLGDGSLQLVTAGLTKGLRMAWGQSGGDTFYSNGVENGYIRSGVSSPWPVNTYHGPEDDRQFLTSIPKAKHIAFRQHGQVLLAVGNAVLANHSPFMFGLFSLRSGIVASFESDVTMLVSVAGGFFASDGRQTWFFRQMEGWYNYRQELVEAASAIPGAVAHDTIKLHDAGIDTDGFGRIWASSLGVCLGTDTGSVVNITKNKVAYPKGNTSGACLIKDHTVINTARP